MRNIEFQSATHGWRLTLAPPTDRLIADLAALEPKPDARETSGETIERLIAQLRIVLETVIVEVPSAPRTDRTPESMTLEEASHLLQALRIEHQGRDPRASITLEDERIRTYCARGMGKMQLGALLAFARRMPG